MSNNIKALKNKVGRPKSSSLTLQQQHCDASKRYRFKTKNAWMDYINSVHADLVLPIHASFIIFESNNLTDKQKIDKVREILANGHLEFKRLLESGKFPRNAFIKHQK